MPSTPYAWENPMIDENYFKNFAGASNATQFLTGAVTQGAQAQMAADNLVGKISTGFNDYYTKQAAALAAVDPNFHPDKYIDPTKLGSVYNAGEGASANRAAATVRAQMDIKAKLDALAKAQAAAAAKKAGQPVSGAAPGTPDPGVIADITAKLAAAKKTYAEAWRDPQAKLAVDKYQAMLDTYTTGSTNVKLDDAALAEQNAAAARVGGALPNAGGPIGNIAPGGPISNESIATGIPYEQQAIAAKNGTPIQAVTGDMAPGGNAQGAIQMDQNGNYVFRNGVYKTLDLAKQAASAAGVAAPNVFERITRDDAGGYIFQGRSYTTLQKAQSAAANAGVQAEYSTQVLPKPVVNNTVDPNLPQRSTYAQGPVGDRQYQLALDRYNAKKNPTPTNLNDVTNNAQLDDYLNNFQEKSLSDMGNTDVTTRDSTGLASAKNFLSSFLSGGTTSGPTTASTTGTPPAYSAEAKLTELRKQYGVDPLEGQVADIDKQIQDIQAAQLTLQHGEENKTVAMGVIGNRVSEEERQTNERIDALNRQKGYLVQQLQNKYTVVNSLMQAANTDYQNAKDLYDTKFNQAVQATNLMLNIDQSQKSDVEKARDDARANVTIVTNAMKDGTLDWQSLDPKTKAQYTQLEIQAGLPTGTISSFSQKDQAQWEMSTVLPGVDSDGNSIATVLQKNKFTGEFKTTKIVTDYSPASTQAAKANVVQQGTFIDSNSNEVAWTKYKDGHVEKSVLGKSKTTTQSMSGDQKAENDFNAYIASLVEKMSSTDSYGTPKLSYQAAKNTLVAKYPQLKGQDDAIAYYLGDPSQYESN